MIKLRIELHWRALYFTTTKVCMASHEATTFDYLDRRSDHVNAFQGTYIWRRCSDLTKLQMVFIDVEGWRQELLLLLHYFYLSNVPYLRHLGLFLICCREGLNNLHVVAVW